MTHEGVCTAETRYEAASVLAHAVIGSGHDLGDACWGRSKELVEAGLQRCPYARTRSLWWCPAATGSFASTQDTMRTLVNKICAEVWFLPHFQLGECAAPAPKARRPLSCMLLNLQALVMLGAAIVGRGNRTSRRHLDICGCNCVTKASSYTASAELG
jgi:hypothetical protein